MEEELLTTPAGDEGGDTRTRLVGGEDKDMCLL